MHRFGLWPTDHAQRVGLIVCWLLGSGCAPGSDELKKVPPVINTPIADAAGPVPVAASEAIQIPIIDSALWQTFRSEDGKLTVILPDQLPISLSTRLRRFMVFCCPVAPSTLWPKTKSRKMRRKTAPKAF